MTENMDWLKDVLNPMGFEQFTPGASAQQKEVLDMIAREREQFALDVAQTFGSAHGKRVIKRLREMTIENSTWCASMGMEKGVPHGFAREGQNALVRWIEDTVKEGVTRKAQPKRENTNVSENDPAVGKIVP